MSQDLMKSQASKYRDCTKSVPAQRRFGELERYKMPTLDIARECSRLTKPSVVPGIGHTPGQPIKFPESSLGSRLVSNLVSQLLLILFPPGIPFFKLDLESVDVRELSKSLKLPDQKTMYDALRETFVSLENSAVLGLESGGDRERLRMILEQSVVAGDSMFVTSDDSLRIIPVSDWVAVRGPSGELVEAIYRESIPVTDDLEGIPISEEAQKSGLVTRYVRAYRSQKRWVVEFFVENDETPYETLQVKDEDFWIHTNPWSLTAGEDYGRGHVEANLGDLRTYETGIELVNQSATALSKIVFMVKPNGGTKAIDVAEAENTQVIYGDPNDVGVVQANKVYDMSAFINLLNGIKQDLDISFMMPTALRRSGERVTAEEIRRMAAEFEKSQGGIYSSLSLNIQKPVAKLLMRNLFKRSKGAFGNLKITDLLAVVNTGLQGLGRNLELENFLMFLTEFLSLNPQNSMKLNMDQVASRLASLRGLEISKLFKTAEELQMEAQAQAMDAMAQQVGPDIIKGAM